MALSEKENSQTGRKNLDGDYASYMENNLAAAPMKSITFRLSIRRQRLKKLTTKVKQGREMQPTCTLDWLCYIAQIYMDTDLIDTGSMAQYILMNS